jgi:hypothetical protein
MSTLLEDLAARLDALPDSASTKERRQLWRLFVMRLKPSGKGCSASTPS